jgi:squalene synthase HpnC
MPAEPAAGHPVEASVGGRLAVLAQARAENFPVATRLLPGRWRRDLLAIYGYARLVDDVGDEAPGERSALLDEVAGAVADLYTGRPVAVPTVAALAPLVRRGLPREPLEDLIAANRMDQVRTRYRDFDELVGYCRLSANPVGRLVLHVAGCATPWRVERSDEVCTALQIVEHLQDVAEDYAAGRIYLPAADLARFGVTEAELSGPGTSAPVRSLVRFEADRARSLLRAGAPLAGSLHGAARVAVAGYLGGGLAALRAIERAGYAVLAGPPRAGRLGVARAAAAVYLRGR